MSISINTRRAYSEVDEFINLLTSEQINKLPKQLKELFNEEKDHNYMKGINPSIPIKDQALMEETLAIIALLNMEFWCEDENEKERLRKVYANNEKTYEEVFQISFDADKIFNKTVEMNTSERYEVKDVIPYKESFIKRIISKIKRIFNVK